MTTNAAPERLFSGLQPPIDSARFIIRAFGQEDPADTLLWDTAAPAATSPAAWMRQHPCRMRQHPCRSATCGTCMDTEPARPREARPPKWG